MGLRQFLSQNRPSLRALLLGSFFFLFGITVVGIGIGAYKITASQFLVKQTKDNLCAQTTLLARLFSYDLELEANSRGIDLTEIGVNKQASSGTEPSTGLGCKAKSLSPAPFPSAPDATPGADVRPIFQDVGQRFDTTLSESVGSTLTGVRMLDPNGTVIASTNDELGLSLANRQEVREALTGRAVWNLREKMPEPGQDQLIHWWKPFDLSNLKLLFYKGSLKLGRPANARVFVNSPIIVDNQVMGAVVASRTPLTMFQVARKYLDIFLLVAIVVVGLSIFLSIFMARRLSNTVYAIVDRAKSYKQGKRGEFKAPLQRPFSREHHQLLVSVTEMANELEKREEHAQYLASHTVHELSNPLTSIQGAIEILNEDFDTLSDAERANFIKLIKSKTNELSELIDELHERTRADRITHAERFEVNTHDLIEHVQRDFPNLAIVDVFEDSDQAIDLNLSSVALESIIKSLIENAYKHGGEDVSVGLKVTRTGSNPDRLEIRVSDTGPGVDEKYRDSIFEPLFSTKPTRAISGLGLANVRKLLELAGGTVELIDSPSGATFEISLPMF
tara:strand:- start:6191 stop:7876 length:1686 start_codon:yes stop_codon:yes gene_type:complete